MSHDVMMFTISSINKESIWTHKKKTEDGLNYPARKNEQKWIQYFSKALYVWDTRSGTRLICWMKW